MHSYAASHLAFYYVRVLSVGLYFSQVTKAIDNYFVIQVNNRFDLNLGTPVESGRTTKATQEKIRHKCKVHLYFRQA